MKTVDEFRQLFDKELMPHLKGLEGRRKSINSRMNVVWIVGGLIVVSPVFIGLMRAVVTLSEGIGGSVFAGASCCFCSGFISLPVGLLLIAICNHFLKRGYVEDYKAEVIGKVVKFMDEGLTYEPKGGIQPSAYHESQLFLTKPDRFHSEDHVKGKVGRTDLEFSEVCTEYKTESEDMDGHTETQWHTIFRGIFFVADFNKDFRGRTLVLPDTAQKAFGGLIGSFFQGHTSGRPDLVKMEDPEFEKLFVVYGTDQVEARYILSPALMQRMAEFRDKTGKNVYFSFTGNRIMVAVPYKKNLFEPSMSKSTMEFDQVRPYFEDLQLIIGIADELNLNTRIWGKQ
ncbi:MAG: DUF3137 domain-containing protein [Candidatus Altiarchaeota archaeon]